VIIIEADEDPRELLLTGGGDVIAANYTITPERRKSVNFTQPYNLADKILVYSGSLQSRPGTVDQLSGSGVPISVRKNSSGSAHLKELVKQGYDLNIEYIPDYLDTRLLLDQIANGSIKAAVLDDNTFRPASRYMQELIEGPVIAESDTIAWGIRGNAPELEQRMNSFLQKHFMFSENPERPRRSAFLNVLRQRYFQEGPQIADFYNPEWHYSNIGLESSYDHVIHSVADSLDLDWKLLTAMIVQESSFNPGAKSWAGAVGLMQIIPRFSPVEYQNLYDPVINIREGAGILKAHLDHYSYLDSLNQKSFALATYNVGLGHMADARRLVIDQNRNPNEWENVADALLMLMQRRYYQNARYGYKRGIETVRYVKEILNRYQMYNKVALYAERNNLRDPGIQTVGMLEP
jgi:membrane-bound lytic murein transglycosylase F